MLGPIANAYLFAGYQMGSILMHVPYGWDWEKKRVYEAKSKLRTIIMYDNIWHNTFGICFCAIRTWQMDSTKDDSDENKSFYMIGIFMTVALMFPLALQVNIARVKQDLPDFVYEFVEFAKEFQEKYVHSDEVERQRSVRHDHSGMFSASLFFLGNTIVILIGLIIAATPHLPLLMTGTVDLPSGTENLWYWVITVPFMILQAVGITLHCFTWFGNQFLYAFPGIEYIFALLYMLQEMQLGRDDYTTFDHLRSPEEFVRNYKAIQVLHSKAMYLFSPIVLPANEWVYLFIASYSVYGAIKMKGLLAAVMFCSAFIIVYYLFVVFTMYARVREESEALLHSWRRSSHPAWVEKTLDSFKPVNILVGSYYFADRSMILNMMKSIFEGSVNLLMLE